MENKRGRKGVKAGAWCGGKRFSTFTRCLRRGFLFIYGVLVGEGHSVMFLLALRRLRCYLFVY